MVLLSELLSATFGRGVRTPLLNQLVSRFEGWAKKGNRNGPPSKAAFFGWFNMPEAAVLGLANLAVSYVLINRA